MIFRFPQPGAADAAGWWLAASAVAASSSLLSLLPPPRNAAAAASVQAYGGFVFVMAIPPIGLDISQIFVDLSYSL